MAAPSITLPDLSTAVTSFDPLSMGFAWSQNTTGAHAQCRCFPGDACWPAPAVWDSFNETVGGRLIATVPLATPCHSLAFNQAECDTVKQAWTLPTTHTETSSSIMAPWFANQSCEAFLPPTSQCVIGAYVQYAVDAREASDYQATISFAKEHNIRLVIRNTGHDWLGKSTGAGAIAIWTHHLKDIEVLDYESDHYTGKALKVAAGVQFQDAFKAGKAAGLVTVGGTCPTVGMAGGYTQGGGHGLTVSKFGLGADQALEWEVVTADGEIITASPEENQDLYWALAGGGGGTYAAVLSLTVKAYPDGITAGANMTFSAAGISLDKFYDGIEAYISGLPNVLDAGATSTWLNNNETFILSPAVGVGMNKKRMDQLHQPVLNKLKKLGINYTYYSAEFPTFLDMYEAMNPDTATATFQIGSRLIPKTVISHKTHEFRKALQNITKLGTWISGVSFNAGNAPKVPNSALKAWRDSYVSLVIGTIYDYQSRENNVASQKLMTNTIVPQISALIPGGGYAYLNEGDPWEPNWRRVFYGDNYQRLLAVKKKYDPDGMFYAWTGVGSEYWKQTEDLRLCKSL